MKSFAERIVRWIRTNVKNSGARGIVMGLSGGVDSAVTGVLCKRAVGEKFLALVLPCHSMKEDIRDAEEFAKLFRMRTQKVDLTKTYDEIISILPPSGKLAQANLKPRLRMITLYHYANRLNYLVAGTGNKSEIEIGYFTKYGDGAVDILPIGGLLKRDVRSLAAQIGIPGKIIKKAPTAGLWKGQTDEGEIGMTYRELDEIISSIESGKTKKLNQASLQKVRRLMKSSMHKREPIPKFIP